jgi:hypothetical protein
VRRSRLAREGSGELWGRMEISVAVDAESVHLLKAYSAANLNHLKVLSAANIEALRHILDREVEIQSSLANFQNHDGVSCLFTTPASPSQPELHCLSVISYSTDICGTKLGWIFIGILFLLMVALLAAIYRYNRLRIQRIHDDHVAENAKLRAAIEEQRIKLENLTTLAVELAAQQELAE